MMKFTVLSLGLALMLGTSSFAQCCGSQKASAKKAGSSCCDQGAKAAAQECGSSCGQSAKAAKAAVAPQDRKGPLTSADVQKLVTGAKKGCEKSKAKLATLKKSCGAGCEVELAKAVAKLEKNCASGCPVSKAKLASMSAQIADGPQKAADKRPMSQQVTELVKNCDKGCSTSKAKVAELKKVCGTECSTELVTRIKAWEKGCEAGCATSKANLQGLGKIMSTGHPKSAPSKATLSEQVTYLVECGDKGCSASKAKVDSLKKACGTECSTELVTRIKAWEKGCEDGCPTSKAKLESLKKIAAPAAKKATKVEKKTSKAMVSDKVSYLVECSEKGCATSKAKVDALKKDCGTECSKSLVENIKAWETGCEQGCDASKAKLEKVQKHLK